MLDDVIKWKHFPRYWPFVRGIHRSPVNSPHKGQWHGALMFSLICIWINVWVNNCEAGDLRHYRGHYVVTGIDEDDGPHTLRYTFSLTLIIFGRWCHNRLLMTSQLPDNCDASTWKVISNPLDINFIHGNIHGPSCKNLLNSLSLLAIPLIDNFFPTPFLSPDRTRLIWIGNETVYYGLIGSNLINSWITVSLYGNGIWVYTSPLDKFMNNTI